MQLQTSTHDSAERANATSVWTNIQVTHDMSLDSCAAMCVVQTHVAHVLDVYRSQHVHTESAVFNNIGNVLG